MPYADIDYQYNSNIYALPRYEEATLAAHGISFADHDVEEQAGLQLLYNWSLQQFYADAVVRHLRYDRTTGFDHDEYAAHGGVNWKIADFIQGIVDYRYERAMVPTLELTGTELFVQNQHLLTGRASYQMALYWHLETEAQFEDLSSPRPGFPYLSLSQYSLAEHLHYSPTRSISAGINFGYLDGHFNGSEFVIAPRYHQDTFEGALHYDLSAFTSLDAAVGYTRRENEDLPPIGGLTGSLGWKYELTSKMRINLSVKRSVDTYVTYLGPELDTSANAGVAWSLSPRTTVTAGYKWAHSTFPLGTVVEGPLQRVDNYQLSSISIRHQALNWLAVKVYAQHEARKSDISIDSFDRTFIGIGLELRLSGQADQPYQLSLPDW